MMNKCGTMKDMNLKECDPCHPPESACGSGPVSEGDDKDCPLSWFDDMVQHAYDYATAEKATGRKIVGIMCEYTPRELIMAANAIPVCLCGGSAETIPPAEAYLPANLCPLIKSTFGYGIEHSNPFLEMSDLLVAETTCDGKKKMYELLAERYPMHILELPQKPDEPEAKRHWIHELRRLRSELETRLGAHITDDDLRSAIDAMNHERKLRRELAKLMIVDNPPLTGKELLRLNSLISCIPGDIRQYERALKMLPGRTLTPPGDSRVRILLTGVPLPHGAERVMEILERSGGLVVCQENCTGVKPLIEDVDTTSRDPLEALAEKYFHLPCSVMTPNTRRLDLLRDMVCQYKPDCIVDLIWQACITYDIESHRIQKLVEEEFGLPYLHIETDYSASDTARITLRVQALFESLNDRKQA